MKRFFVVLMLLAGMYIDVDAASASQPIVNEDRCCLPSISVLSDSPPRKWKILADFLYWGASEETSSIWASIDTDTSAHTSTFEGKGISFDWNTGFRSGVGYNMEHDQWDTQLYWTWYRTQANSQIAKNHHTILSEFFAGFINDDIAESAKINWKMFYNMFDWELGRNFWVTQEISFRPFMGLKGGWIDQSIESDWQNVIIFPLSYFSSTETLKNNFWGIGPSGGVNTKWKLMHVKNHYLSLVGNFSAATLFGTWVCKDKYTNSTSKEIEVNMKNSTLGALMFRGCLGIGWDGNIGSSYLSASLSYDMQFWLNQLRIPTFQQLRLHGDLTLQGATFDVRWDF